VVGIAQHRITLQTFEDTAREILKGIMLKIFLAKQRSFIKIITNRLKKHADEIIKEKDKTIFIEHSDDLDYIKNQHKKLEAFLDSGESQLGKDGSKEYETLKNDRIIQKVKRGAHKVSDKVKIKGLKMALGNSDVRGFFFSLGIAVYSDVIK
jgi:hypothetical protein